MKRVLAFLLAACMAILPTVSIVAEDEEIEVFISESELILGRDDASESDSDLDNLNNANASIVEQLGKKDWTALAAEAKKKGDWREDIVSVAQTQVGYAQEKNGMTIYTAWAEYEEAQDWTTLFVNWVAVQAGLTEKQFPHMDTYQAFTQRMKKLGALKDITRASYPMSGDLALIEKDGQQLVGVVVYVSNGVASVIIGDDNGAVTLDLYSVNKTGFTQYVDLDVLMIRAGIEVGKGGKVPVIPEGGVAAWTNTNAVYMRSEPTTASQRVTTVKKPGTALLVVSAEMQGDGYIWYGVEYGKYEGYIRGDLLDLDMAAVSFPADAPETTPVVTPAPTVVPGCAVCMSVANGVALPVDCCYEHLASMDAMESYRFMSSLKEDDYLTFVLYVNCHNAHVVEGMSAVICHTGCEQSIYAPVAPGVAHGESCSWYIAGVDSEVLEDTKTPEQQETEGVDESEEITAPGDNGLGLELQERVVNIVINQPVNTDGTLPGEEVTFTYEVFGAKAYQWFQVEIKEVNEGDITTEEEITTLLLGENSTTLTVVANDENEGNSYFCEATIEVDGDDVIIASKPAMLNVASMIIAQAIIGEEVYFTYNYDGAASYQWYMKPANSLGLQTSSSINGFNAIQDANDETLSLIADLNQSGAMYFCMALASDGSELGRSGYYTYEIPMYESYDVDSCLTHDLCKYVNELANMTRAERYEIMTGAWNVEIGGQSLADLVRAHWMSESAEMDHNDIYSTLLCTCATMDEPGAVHTDACPWRATKTPTKTEREYVDPCKTENHQANVPDKMVCVYEFLAALNPLAQYNYLMNLYNQDADAYYDFYMTYCAHLYSNAGSRTDVLCSCHPIYDEIGTDDMPGAACHQFYCNWYFEGNLSDRENAEPGFMAWAETATKAMLDRAMKVKSLDHAVFEENGDGTYTLYIARYAEPVGSVDVNGFLTYGEPAVVVAWVDFSAGMVYFINDLPEHAPSVPNA